MMRITLIPIALIALFLPLSSAFAPMNSMARPASKPSPVGKVVVNMGFGLGDGEEPKRLTRDSEPDEFFQTNTDKMSDQEKIPIALGGLAFVSLPFILGLIALYSSK